MQSLRLSIQLDQSVRLLPGPLYVGDGAAVKPVPGSGLLLLLLELVRGGRLPGRDARDGHPEGAAGHVVEPLRMEEVDRVWLAAVLTADANLTSRVYVSVSRTRGTSSGPGVATLRRWFRDVRAELRRERSSKEWEKDTTIWKRDGAGHQNNSTNPPLCLNSENHIKNQANDDGDEGNKNSSR